MKNNNHNLITLIEWKKMHGTAHTILWFKYSNAVWVDRIAPHIFKDHVRKFICNIQDLMSYSRVHTTLRNIISLSITWGMIVFAIQYDKLVPVGDSFPEHCSKTIHWRRHYDTKLAFAEMLLHNAKRDDIWDYQYYGSCDFQQLQLNFFIFQDIWTMAIL